MIMMGCEEGNTTEDIRFVKRKAMDMPPNMHLLDMY